MSDLQDALDWMTTWPFVDDGAAKRDLVVKTARKYARRIVFLNGITDTYLLSIEGRCSIFDDGNQTEGAVMLYGFETSGALNALAVGLWTAYITVGVFNVVVSPWWYLMALPGVVGAGVRTVKPKEL